MLWFCTEFLLLSKLFSGCNSIKIRIYFYKKKKKKKLLMLSKLYSLIIWTGVLREDRRGVSMWSQIKWGLLGKSVIGGERAARVFLFLKWIHVEYVHTYLIFCSSYQFLCILGANVAEYEKIVFFIVMQLWYMY